MIPISQSLSHPIYASNYLLALHLLDYKARSRVRHTERKSEFLLNSGPIRNVNNFEISLNSTLPKLLRLPQDDWNKEVRKRYIGNP